MGSDQRQMKSGTRQIVYVMTKSENPNDCSNSNDNNDNRIVDKKIRNSIGAQVILPRAQGTFREKKTPEEEMEAIPWACELSLSKQEEFIVKKTF